MNVGTLTISLTARTVSLAKAAGRVKTFERGVVASVQRINASIATVGMSFSALTIPIAAVGIGATKMFSDFEFSLARVEGLVGIARDQTRQWGAEVLELSKYVGRSANEMGEALYFVSSAGIRGANTMKVVKASAQAAAAGMGESKEIADLLTSAINAYGEANLSVADSMDILVTAVREGKVEASDLILSLGKVLPISSAMSVSFNEVGAAVAGLTRTGTPARTAGMMIRRMLLGIQKPSKMATDTLNEMGETFENLRNIAANEEGGLLKTLLRIKKLTDEFGTEKMALIFPNLRSYLPALDLLGENLEKNKNIWMEMLEPTGNFKLLLDATANTFQRKFAVAVNAAGEALIQLGHTFAQNLIPVIEEFAERVRNFSKWWTNLPRQTQNLIIKFTLLTGVIGPLLILFSSLVGIIISVTSSLATLVSGVIIGGILKLVTSIYSLGKALISLKVISGITAAFTAFRGIVTSTALITGIGSLVTALGKLAGGILAFSAGTAIIGILAAIAAMTVLVVANFEQWQLSMPKIMDQIKLELASFFTWANEQMASFFDWLEGPNGFNKLGKLLNNIGGFSLRVLGADVENPQEWYRQASADNKKLTDDLEKKLADPANYAKGAMTFQETFIDSIDKIKEKVPQLLSGLTSKLFGGPPAGSFPSVGKVAPIDIDKLIREDEAARAMFDDLTLSAEQLGIAMTPLQKIFEETDMGLVRAFTSAQQFGEGFDYINTQIKIYEKMIDDIHEGGFFLEDEDLQKVEKYIDKLIKLREEKEKIKFGDIGAQMAAELAMVNEQSELLGGSFLGMESKLRAFRNTLQALTNITPEAWGYMTEQMKEDWADMTLFVQQKIIETEGSLKLMSTFMNGLGSMFTSLGEGIGKAFAGVDNAFQGLLDSLLAMVKQIGQVLIGIGTAMAVIPGLQGNAASYILGGTMIVALASGVQAAVNKKREQAANMANGGIVPPGYPNDSYPAMLTSGEKITPPQRLPEFERQKIEVTVKGIQRGEDIYYVLDEYTNKKKNTYG